MQAMNFQNPKRNFSTDGELVTMRKAQLTALIENAVNEALAMNLDKGTERAPEQAPNLPMTMTVEDVCAALHLSKPTVYELTRNPDFPCFHVGKKILVNRTRLQDWIDAQCEKGAH